MLLGAELSSRKYLEIETFIIERKLRRLISMVKANDSGSLLNHAGQLGVGHLYYKLIYSFLDVGQVFVIGLILRLLYTIFLFMDSRDLIIFHRRSVVVFRGAFSIYRFSEEGNGKARDEDKNRKSSRQSPIGRRRIIAMGRELK